MAINAQDAFTRFQQILQKSPNLDQKAIEEQFKALLLQTNESERDKFTASVDGLLAKRDPRLAAQLQQPQAGAGVQRGNTTAAQPAEPAPPPAITEKPVDVTQASYSTQQFRALAQQQLQIVQQVQRDIAANRAKQDAEVAQTTHDRDAALADLAQAVLPDINPTTLAAAYKMTGLRPEQIADLPGEEAKVKQQLTEANAGVDKALGALGTLLHVPADGADAVAKKDSDEMHQKLTELQKKLTEYNGAQGLIDRGYDTPNDHRWYTDTSYWQDRNAANALMAHFGKHSWGEVAKDYQALMQQIDALQQQANTLDIALANVTSARSVTAGLQTQLQNLPADVLHRAQDTVARIFRTTAKEDLAKRLTNPDLVTLYKTYSALAAKVDYMGELSKKLAEQEQKYADEAMRLQKDAIGWADNKLRKGQYGTLTQKQAMWRLGCYDWDARARAYNRSWIINQRIYGYNTYYNSPSLLETWLWWYVFTGGFYDTWYRPIDVNVWLESHPDYHYNPRPGGDSDAGQHHGNPRPGGDTGHDGNPRPGGDDIPGNPRPGGDDIPGNPRPGGDPRTNS
jgi:hypothetical protein